MYCCVTLCGWEETLRLFMAEEMMLSRINMAKSFYQLYNGQATWLRSKHHHLPTEGTCVQVHICVCVCVGAPTCNLFIIWGAACTYTHMCVFGSVCMCVCPGSFNQRPIAGRWGDPVSLLPQIKLSVSMPVTYLIWDAPLSSAHLTMAHTDSTLLHTSMMLAPPEEDDKEER